MLKLVYQLRKLCSLEIRSFAEIACIIIIKVVYGAADFHCGVWCDVDSGVFGKLTVVI